MMYKRIGSITQIHHPTNSSFMNYIYDHKSTQLYLSLQSPNTRLHLVPYIPPQPTPLLADMYSPYLPAVTSWRNTVIPNRALHNRGCIVAKRSTRAQFGDRRFNSAFWSGGRWSGARVSQVNVKPSVIWLGNKTLLHTYT